MFILFIQIIDINLFLLLKLQIPYIEIARKGKNNWWHYVVGVILTFMPVLFWKYLDWVRAQDFNVATVYYCNFVYRAGFIGVMMLIIKYLHHKKVKTIFTAYSRFDLKKQ